jgi:probable HAF family extracellular repeat protein
MLVTVTVLVLVALPGAASAELFVSSANNNEVLRYHYPTGDFIPPAFVAKDAGGLDFPQGLVFGPDGNLYVLSQRNSQVLRYNGTTGTFIDIFVGNDGELYASTALAFGPDGNLYVAAHGLLRYHGTTGAFIDRFVPSGSGGLTDVLAFTFGPDGNIYIANVGQGTGEVLRYNGKTGHFIDTFVIPGAAFLNRPTGIAFGPDGNLYVADLGFEEHARVLRYNGKTGHFIDVFVAADSGGLSFPAGFAFGPDGNLYIGSGGSSAVLRYDGTTGTFIDAFVPQGHGGLDNPAGLVFRPQSLPTFPPTGSICQDSFQGLGTLPGHVSSFAFGISGDGRVVVGTSFDDSGVGQAFRWTAATGMVGLGALPPDFPSSEAHAANADGSIVVGHAAFFDVRLAFRWTEATGLQALTPVTASPRAETAAGISPSGDVIVGAAAVPFEHFHAYRWTEQDGLVDLGFLTGSNDVRWGVSADGRVIAGVTVDEDGQDQAFRWTARSGPVLLPRLPGAVSNGVSGISGRGDVTVGFDKFADNGLEATAWRRARPVGLGTVEDDFLSNALKTSGDGIILVGTFGPCLGCEQATAFVTGEHGGIRDLRAVLVRAGLGDKLEGWQLLEANDISQDGSVVSGVALSPQGRLEGFVATVCRRVRIVPAAPDSEN